MGVGNTNSTAFDQNGFVAVKAQPRKLWEYNEDSDVFYDTRIEVGTHVYGWVHIALPGLSFEDKWVDVGGAYINNGPRYNPFERLSEGKGGQKGQKGEK